MGCSGSAIAEGKFFDEYVLGQKLGQGSFGQVREAFRREQKEVAKKRAEKLAVKIFNQHTSKALIRREVDIWRVAGQHPNAVRLFELLADDSLHYAVMEKCAGDILDAWDHKPDAGEELTVEIFRGMLLGLNHVHSLGIVHRDVKPDNFLLGGADGKVVKLADYGLSAMLPAGGLLKPEVAGTPPYMAPEMLKHEAYDTSVDMWSLGATCYLILYGEFPYMPARMTPCDMKEAIAIDYPRPTFVPSPEVKVSSPSPAAQSFVKELLQRHPKSRPMAQSCLALPLMQVAISQDVSGEAGKKPVLSAVRKARKRTWEFAKAVDPTQQRSLDELLEALQKRHGFVGLLRSFSGPDMKVAAVKAAQPKMFERSSRRVSTHSGEVTVCEAFCR